jgi:hypothetical protein
VVDCVIGRHATQEPFDEIVDEAERTGLRASAPSTILNRSSRQAIMLLSVVIPAYNVGDYHPSCRADDAKGEQRNCRCRRLLEGRHTRVAEGRGCAVAATEGRRFRYRGRNERPDRAPAYPAYLELGISYYGRTYVEGKKINWKDGIKALWYILEFRFR